MELTGGTRAMITAGAAVLTGGLAILIHGIIRSDLARTLGGGCLATTAVFLLAIVVICRGIVDTREERADLAEDKRAAVAERAKYFAAQAALENEQGRLNQNVNAERARIAEQLRVERAAMAAEFEEKKNALVAETIESFALMLAEKRFAPAPQGKLIPFPGQQPAPERTIVRERSREHGAIGP